jgi:hypothetical protein
VSTDSQICYVQSKIILKLIQAVPVVVVESVVWDRNPVTIKKFKIQIFLFQYGYVISIYLA